MTYGIGKWLDRQLQPICKKLPYYLSSSKHLKQKLTQQFETQTIRNWDNIRMFTCDAVSMYTNIETEHALEEISNFLRYHPLCQECDGLYPPAIIEVLEIVTKSNIFKFDNTIWLQLTGIAMGTPSACMQATLCQAIHKERFIPKYNNTLRFWSRLIDDGIGIWELDPAPIRNQELFEQFQKDINFGKLTWTFTELKTLIDYLDLTLNIKNKQITTTIYEKP